MPWFTWFKVIRVMGVDSPSYEHNTLEYLSTTDKDINLPNSFSTFLRCFVQLDQRLSSTMLKVMSSEWRFAQKPKRKPSKVPAVQTNSIYAILHGSLWIRPCSKKDYWECCVRSAAPLWTGVMIILYQYHTKLYQTLHFLMTNQSSLEKGFWGLGRSNDPCQKKVQICTCTHAGENLIN